MHHLCFMGAYKVITNQQNSEKGNTHYKGGIQGVILVCIRRKQIKPQNVLEHMDYCELTL